MNADALPAGTPIDGCEIERVVAGSSFGIVYAARDPGSARRYAVKEYLPVSLAVRSADGIGIALRGPEHAEAFERGLLAFAAEARLLEQRTHLALLRVLRSVRAHGSIYRVMPWLDGETLLALRRSMADGPDEAALRRLLFGLLGALQALHDAGEVHGAVSPGNIMVLSDDRPLLLDTGAVGRALLGGQTRVLMAQVSPGFSPRGAAAAGTAPAVATPAADLHALAEVAHFCVTGTLPVAGEPHAPLAAAARGLRPRGLRAPYSASLLETIDAALADDLARRPANVAEFRAALAGQGETLRPALAHAPAHAHAPAPATTPTLAAVPMPVADAPGRTEPSLAPTPPSAPVAAAAPAAPRPVPAAHPVRRSTTRQRRSRRLAWWGAGAFAALTLGTAGMVVMQERAALQLRSTPGTVTELEPPAARALPAAPPVPVEAASPAPVRPGTPAPATSPTPPPPTPPRVAAEAAAPAAPAAATKPAPAIKPGKPAPVPVPAPAPKPRVPAGPDNPRAECGARTEFALYRCMQMECQQARWAKHPQCVRLRETDAVE